MVFNYSLVLACSILLPKQVSFDEAYFKQKANNYRSGLIANGILALVPSQNSDSEYWEDIPKSESFVAYQDFEFLFNKATGNLRIASSKGVFDGPPPGSASMPPAQIATMSLAACEIFEGSNERVAKVHDIVDGTPKCYFYGVSVWPSTNGIQHSGSDFEAHFRLEHSTGRLVKYYPPRVPRCNPPATLTPTVSLEDAVATAASHVGNVSDPPPVVLTSTPFLCIYKTDIPQGEPNLDYRKTWFNSADWAAFNSNTGVLAYSIDLALIDAYIPDRGVYSRYERCYVNAMDGRLMAELSTMGIGGGGRGTRTTFSGELESGPLTLRHGKSQFKIVDASTVPTSAPSHPTSKRLKVMLVRGSLYIQAEFDPKLGLLRFGSKRPVWAKPNPPLLAALRKLAG